MKAASRRVWMFGAALAAVLGFLASSIPAPGQQSTAAQSSPAQKSTDGQKAADAPKPADGQKPADAPKPTKPGEKAKQQEKAKGKNAARRGETAKEAEEKRAQAEKLYAALQTAWKIEAEQTRLTRDLSVKEAAVQKASVAAAAADEAMRKSPEDQKWANRAAQAKAASEQARVARDAALQTLADKTAASQTALDEAAVLENQLLGGLEPISSKEWDYAKARHLLFRAGFGGSPEEVERLLAMGLHKAVDYLVEYHDQPVANLELDIRPQGKNLSYQRYFAGEAAREINQRRQRNFRNQVTSMRHWWLRRMAETPRPLEEKLTLFWHDHFAVNYRDFNDPYLVFTQNQLFRRYADQFDALLHGTVQDPAMIRYLDNHTNRKGSGNENLGRELQELFSIGEANSANHKSNGYTEEDVREASRALTGYTYDVQTGQFRFLGTRYDEGPKRVLGRTGTWSGDEVVDIILQHPATASYAAKKLFEFFVHRNPKDETLATLAHVLRSNGYDLRPMLKNLFRSREFYSDTAMTAQIKSPAEVLVGTIRMLGLKEVDYAQVDNACQIMGLTLFEPPNVAGWDEGRAWITSKQLLDRYNYVAELVDRSRIDVVAALEGRELKSAGDVIDHLVERCLTTKLNAGKRQALIQFLGDLPPSSDWARQREQINTKLRSVIVMLLGTPEFQLS
jgi:uncharacterized protein (DUF1800 family)